MKNIFIGILVLAILILGSINTIKAQISTQPVNDSICTGQDAEFSLEASGSSTFQWQSSFNEVGWLDIPENMVYSGVTNDTLQLISPTTEYADSSYRCIVTDGGDLDTSNTVQLVFNPDLPVSVTITLVQNEPICLGDEVSFAAETVNAGLAPTFQWIVDGNDVGVNNDTLTTDILTDDHEIYCIVSSSLPCPFINYATSNVIEVTVNPNLPAEVTIEVISNNTSICSGDEVSFAAIPVNGGPSPLYQWFFDGGDIGVPLETDTITTDTMTVNHDVHCLMSSSLPCPENNFAFSDTIEMIVYGTLTTNVSDNQEICIGETPDELSSDPSGGPDDQYSFQWQDSIPNGSWANLPGDTLENYQPGALIETTFYRVILNNNLGCDEHISSPIEITVYDALSTNVSADQEICSGDTPEVLISEPAGGSTPPDYLFQWQDSIPNGSWADLSDDTLENYQPGPLFETTYFRVILNNNIGCNQHISVPIEIMVYDALSTSVSPDQEICGGDTPDILYSNPEGGNDNQYSFQWQDSIPDVSWQNIPGAESDTYQPDPLNESTYFRVILNNDLGCNEHISNPIKVTVYDALSTTVSDDQVVCSGDAPDELSSGPEGGPIGNPGFLFQWQDSIPDGNWQDIIGAESETYQSDPLDEITFFRVLLNNTIGCNQHISNVIQISVIPSKNPFVIITASPNIPCDNEEVIFSIADSLNGGNDPSFEWYLNNDPKSTADTWSSYVNDNDEVYVKMTSNAECLISNPVNSDIITMTVHASPQILNSGELVPKPLDNPVLLICVDSLETNTYKWYENGVEIPNADEKFYYPSKYGLTFNDGSEYHVMVANEFCYSYSEHYLFDFNKSTLFEESEVFIVYPNPNNGDFSLVLNEEILPEDFESCTFRIFDITGKIIFKDEIFGMEQNIELSDIQQGLYFLDVKISDSQHQVIKIIIE